MLIFITLVYLVTSAISIPEKQGLFRSLPKNEKVDTSNGRIVGGQVVDISEYPWQLSLQEFGRHICGASIISLTWALTAAHCVEDSTVNSLSLRAGSSNHSSGGILYSLANGYIHGYYNASLIDYDVAVLEVSSPFQLGVPGINTVSLPRPGYYPRNGTILYVSGWGYTTVLGPWSAQLRFVDVPAVSRIDCRIAFGNAITDRMLCAGYPEGGKDACFFDSGGALVENATVVGIVSWGAGCATPNKPGVYTDVGSIRDWITLVTGV